ncbi:MAG: hypothetical protein AB1540_05845 [Bdellovibrionota bacterium]
MPKLGSLLLFLSLLFTAPPGLAASDSAEIDFLLEKASQVSTELKEKSKALTATDPKTPAFKTKQDDFYRTLGKSIGHLIVAREMLLDQIESKSQSADLGLSASRNRHLSELKGQYALIAELLNQNLSNQPVLKLTLPSENSLKSLSTEQNLEKASFYRGASKILLVAGTFSLGAGLYTGFGSLTNSPLLDTMITVGSALNAAVIYALSLGMRWLSDTAERKAQGETFRVYDVMGSEMAERVESIFKGIADEQRVILPEKLEGKLSWLANALERQETRSKNCEKLLRP